MSDMKSSFVTPDYTIKVENKSQGFLLPDSAVSKLIILEDINRVPEIKMYVRTSFASRVILLDDLNITIEDGDSYRISFTFGVFRAKTFQQYVLYEGYMCERAFFIEPGSEYLGDTLSDAIDALKLRDKADGIDSIEGGYWRLNETRMEAFKRCMRGAKENSIWVVNTEEIKVIDLSQEPTQGQDFIAPTSMEFFSYNNRYTSEGIYNLYQDEDADVNPMYNAVWNAMSYIGFDHKDFTQNVISSMKYDFPMEQLMKFIYDSVILQYDVGSVMKMELDEYTTENMYLVSKVTTFATEGISTVAYFSLGQEFKPPKGGGL